MPAWATRPSSFKAVGQAGAEARQTSDYGNNGSTSYSVNSNDNWQQGARRLLKPEEVLGLSERIAITFTPGIPPIWTTLVRYYERGFRDNRRIWLRVKVFGLSVALFAAAVMVLMGLSGMNIHRFLVR